MVKLRNSLQAKIVAAFAVITVAMMVSVQIVHSVTYVREQQDLTDLNRYNSAMTQAAGLLTEVLVDGEYLQQYLRTGDNQHLVAFKRSQQRVGEQIQSLEQLLASDDRAMQVLRQEVKPGISLLDQTLAEASTTSGNHQTHLDLVTGWQASFPSKVSELQKQVSNLSEQAQVAYMDSTAQSYRTILLASALLMLVAIALGNWLARSIASPLKRLMQGIHVAMAGEYRLVEGISATDEIGELVLAFNKMIKAIGAAQADLAGQNEELQAQGEELAAQNEEILAQQDELQDTIVKLEQHEGSLNRLYGFSQRLTRTIELDELLNQVLDGLMQEAHAQVGTVLLRQPETGELHARVAFGLVSPEKLPVWHVGEGLLGQAALSDRMTVARFGEGQLHSQGLSGEWSMASEIYLPLKFHGDLLGVVALGRTESATVPLDEQQRLTALADQVTVALHNALAHLEVREALEQIQDLDRLKSELLSTVSHELRTPLASILGFTELLLKKSPSEEKARKYLATIHSEALRLTALINDFLDLQRIENGRLDFAMQQTDLGSLIRHSAEVYEGQSHHHSFNVEIEDSLPPVWVDPDRVSQVLGNLIGNAVKYSPRGGPIEIKAFRKSPTKVIISVRDYGLGIPQEALGQLFQPFFRVDNSDRREIGGTGLGLAICQKIIRAHGGEIWVESVHGQGSTFAISLPIAAVTEIAPRSTAGELQPISVVAEVAASRAPAVQPTILVVEDDQAMADLLAEALDAAGYGPTVVDNGPGALTLAQGNRPVAVILDLTLKGSMDGWEVLRRLKRQSLTNKIPVIICSCADNRRQGLEMGAAEYLVKPFPPERLVQILATVTAMDNGAVGMPHPKSKGNAEETLKEILESKGFAVQEMISHTDVIIVNLETSRPNDDREVNTHGT